MSLIEQVSSRKMTTWDQIIGLSPADFSFYKMAYSIVVKENFVSRISDWLPKVKTETTINQINKRYVDASDAKLGQRNETI